MWNFVLSPFFCLFVFGVVCDPQWGAAVLMGPWQCDKVLHYDFWCLWRLKWNISHARGFKRYLVEEDSGMCWPQLLGKPWSWLLCGGLRELLNEIMWVSLNVWLTDHLVLLKTRATKTDVQSRFLVGQFKYFEQLLKPLRFSGEGHLFVTITFTC